MTEPTGSIRLMPKRWFQASNLNSPIIEMIERGHGRPLAEGERRLGAFILPPFQRPPVWTRDQQVRLIESIWNGLPIGAYVHNQVIGFPFDQWLLDGQQRVTAILRYMLGDFPVFGWRFTDLPRAERLGFELTPVAQLQTRLTSKEDCQDVYNRLAYGGTSHAPQEGKPWRPCCPSRLNEPHDAD